MKTSVLIFLIILISGCGHDSSPDESLSGEDLEAARYLFTYWCSGCHGQDAQGNGPRPNIVGKTIEQINNAFNTVSAMSSLSAVVSSEDVEKISAYLNYLETDNRHPISQKNGYEYVQIVDANARFKTIKVSQDGAIEIPCSMRPPLLLKRINHQDSLLDQYGFSMNKNSVCLDQYSDELLNRYGKQYGGLDQLFELARLQGTLTAIQWELLEEVALSCGAITEIKPEGRVDEK